MTTNESHRPHVHESCDCGHPVIDHAIEYGGCRQPKCSCKSSRRLIVDEVIIGDARLFALRAQLDSLVKVWEDNTASWNDYDYGFNQGIAAAADTLRSVLKAYDESLDSSRHF